MQKKQILYTIFFFLITYVVLFITEKSFDFLIKKNHDFKPCYVASGRIQADILFQGNSRSLLMLDPEIMENKLKSKCYNTGIAASDISHHIAILRLYLKYNKKPKYIFLEVSPMYLGKFEITYFPSSYYVPFLNDKEIYKIVKSRSPKVALLSYIPLGKYTIDNDRLLNEVIKGGIQFVNNSSKETHFKKGYQPLDSKWDGIWDNFKKDNPGGARLVLDSTNLQKHIEFIQLTQKHNIKLICYEAPSLNESLSFFSNRDSLLKVLDNVFTDYKVPYLKFGNIDGISDKKEYFFNATHTNRTGSEAFSTYFANYLLSNNILSAEGKN